MSEDRVQLDNRRTTNLKAAAIILLAVGVALGIQEFVEGEYLLSLTDNVNEDVFIRRIKTNYKLDIYGEDDGENTYAIVFDSGIDTDHGDFGGRAIWTMNVGDLRAGTDDNGHGTHCAGTADSNSYGVAKQLNIVAVKVLNAIDMLTSPKA
ncbi:hypothetical protein LSH36_1612g00034 [Paralvinella palmiformis]|uniref:Peptidase S8/S53 domain-containing protein n=1 Tax=Paralvinella palmiformis TaxID=53620 RepID=A0AAD9ITI4_9ANNE|nr:hypothetical protein LSH36_1612g00034 [Paralvinella palmiformis]